MYIHLSKEAVHYVEAQLAKTGCRSPSEFVERLLRELRRGETSAEAEKQAWLRAQEGAAARVWDNDLDAAYDRL